MVLNESEVSDVITAIEMYQRLKRSYENAGFDEGNIKTIFYTARVELFNTDRLNEPPYGIEISPDGSVIGHHRRLLNPSIPAVLSSLVWAEKNLNDYLSGKQEESQLPRFPPFLSRRLVNVIAQYANQKAK